MKVLVTIHPGHGHFHPLVTLLKTLNENHEVIIFTAETFSEEIGKHDLRVIGYDSKWALSTMRSDFKALESIPPYELGVPFIKLCLTRIAYNMIPKLIELVSKFQPDIIISEHTEFCGRLVAEQFNIPSIVSGTGIPFDRTAFSSILSTEYNQLRRYLTLKPDPMCFSLYPSIRLCFFDSSWVSNTSEHNVFIMPTIPQNDYPDNNLEELLNFPDNHPLIHVSLGTIFDDTKTLLHKIIIAYRNQPINVIISSRLDLHSIPESRCNNIKIVTYIPHNKLLPHCSLFVTHGGFNSLVAGIMCGIPMLALPIAFDQSKNMLLARNTLGIAEIVEHAIIQNTFGELYINPDLIDPAKLLHQTKNLLAKLDTYTRRIITQRQKLSQLTSVQSAAKIILYKSNTASIERPFKMVIDFILETILNTMKTIFLEKNTQLEQYLNEVIDSMKESFISYDIILKSLLCLVIYRKHPNLRFLFLQLHQQYIKKYTDYILTRFLAYLSTHMTDSIKDYHFHKDGFVVPKNRKSLPNPVFTEGHAQPPREPLEIAIVIPVKNNQPGINKFLESFFSNTPQSLFPKAIIIVDNNSDIGISIPIQYQGKEVDISCEPCSTPGAAAARNLGVSIASGKHSVNWVLFLDSDCLVTSTTISGHLCHNKFSVAYQGKIRSKDNNWLSQFYNHWLSEFEPETPTQLPNYLVTANVMVHVPSFNDIHGFDEAFSSAGGEDFDLAVRLKSRGPLAFSKKTCVKHQYTEHSEKVTCEDFEAFYSRFKRYGFWNKRVHQKHGEIEVSRNNHEHLRNLSLWLYARWYKDAVSSEADAMQKKHSETPLKAMSHTQARIFMFHALQQGGEEFEKAALPSP